MNTQLSLDDLRARFPRTGKRRNRAITGPIPMQFLMEHQTEFRRLSILHGLRRFYRGPRTNNKSTAPSSTMRKDATAVVLYFK